MLLIECPWCGPRAESEFSCGGEADIARPLETDKLSDREWGDYLFMRTNTRGTHREQWIHAQAAAGGSRSSAIRSLMTSRATKPSSSPAPTHRKEGPK